MKKLIFILFISIFLLSFISASDEQLIIGCGGDKELQILCSLGDEELNNPYYAKEPVGEIVEQGFFGKPFEGGMLYVYLIIGFVVLILLTLLFFFIMSKRKRKKRR